MNQTSMDSAARRRLGRRGYDRLAPVYALIERVTFGPKLQQSRVALINELPNIHRILMLGDGDGRLTAVVAATYPNATVLSVDQSRRMLAMQRRRIPTPRRPPIVWVQADARDLELQPGSFDLVVMPYFLDCFDQHELNQHLARWLSWIDDHGTLLHVDFRIPDGRWQRLFAKPLLAIMHAFFRHTTGLSNRHLIDIESMLKNLGWAADQDKRMHADMIRSTIYRRHDGDSPSQSLGSETS